MVNHQPGAFAPTRTAADPISVLPSIDSLPATQRREVLREFAKQMNVFE